MKEKRWAGCIMEEEHNTMMIHWIYWPLNLYLGICLSFSNLTLCNVSNCLHIILLNVTIYVLHNQQLLNTYIPLRMVRPSLVMAMARHVMLLTVMRSSSSLRAKCHTRMSWYEQVT